MDEPIEAEAKRHQILRQEDLQAIEPEDTFVSTLQQVRLVDTAQLIVRCPSPTGDKIEEGWKAYALDPGKGTSRTSRLNMGGMCALSRRLMAAERARVLGRKPFNVRMWALEQAAGLLAEKGHTGNDVQDCSDR